MQVSSGARQQVEVSRQELYEDYVRCYHELCPESQPCSDGQLLEKVAQYLLREPRPEGTFTVFPFYQAVGKDQEADNPDCRKHLSAFIKATELLETLCINLFLQPWKKEFKTLKTFTGPFVYCLLPVLRRSTIQSVLASIGYLPHTDPRVSEFRLSGDVNPDRAIMLGFELLLARMECYHLLKFVEKDHLGPHEWLELLRRREGAMKVEKPTEEKMTAIQTKKEMKEEKDRKEVPLYSVTRLNPEPKPRRCHLISTDQSIMEIQRTYPDLAFRGRPLVPDKPHRAKSSSKAAHIAIPNYSDNIEVAEPPNRNYIKGTKASPTTVCSQNDGSKMDVVLADGSRGGGCHDIMSGHATCSGFRKEGHSTADNELSGPQAISHHIPLKAGVRPEEDLKPVECPTTAESSAGDTDTRQHTLHIGRVTRPELSSLTSADEEPHLRELAEKMAQFQLSQTKEELKGKGKHGRGENTNKERWRRKDKKTVTEEEVEQKNLRKPVETSPAPSPAAGRCIKSSQLDAGLIKEQKTDPSTSGDSTAECQDFKAGSKTRQQQEREGMERVETGRGDEEQVAQNLLTVEHHKK